MITERDIKKRITEILSAKGFNVVASEVDEGFSKPAVFINVYPTTVTTDFTMVEHITDTIEIKYIPSVETVEECAITAETIRSIFMHKPFNIKDRHFTIQEMEFEIEKYILYAYFDFEYYQAVENVEEYEKIENLEMEGDI